MRASADSLEPMRATAAESTAECIVHDPTAEMRAAAAEEDARVERALDRVTLLLDRRYAVPPSPEAPPEGKTSRTACARFESAGQYMYCTIRLSTRVPLAS